MDVSITSYPETHQQGTITLENILEGSFPYTGDFGIQIAADGRVWVCIDGIAFIRFSPHRDGKMSNDKSSEGDKSSEEAK